MVVFVFVVVGVVDSGGVEGSADSGLRTGGVFVEEGRFFGKFEAFEVVGYDAAAVHPDDDGFVAGVDHAFFAFADIVAVLDGGPVSGVVAHAAGVSYDDIRVILGQEVVLEGTVCTRGFSDKDCHVLDKGSVEVSCDFGGKFSVAEDFAAHQEECLGFRHLISLRTVLGFFKATLLILRVRTLFLSCMLCCISASICEKQLVLCDDKRTVIEMENARELTEDEWKEKLSKEEYRVLREKGTERAFTGEFWKHKEKGTYKCAGCGVELFSSDAKFDSGSGWPSFYRALDKDKIEEKLDLSHGMRRIEVLCKNCGGHLGHLFDDGPRDKTGCRYCINSIALDFEKEE